MKILNLVYNIKKAKSETGCAVERLKMAYFLNKKTFTKSLPSCKYVNPLQRSYLKTFTCRDGRATHTFIFFQNQRIRGIDTYMYLAVVENVPY